MSILLFHNLLGLFGRYRFPYFSLIFSKFKWRRRKEELKKKRRENVTMQFEYDFYIIMTYSRLATMFRYFAHFFLDSRCPPPKIFFFFCVPFFLLFAIRKYDRFSFYVLSVWRKTTRSHAAHIYWWIFFFFLLLSARVLTTCNYILSCDAFSSSSRMQICKLKLKQCMDCANEFVPNTNSFTFLTYFSGINAIIIIIVLSSILCVCVSFVASKSAHYISLCLLVICFYSSFNFHFIIFFFALYSIELFNWVSITHITLQQKQHDICNWFYSREEKKRKRTKNDTERNKKFTHT